VRRLALYAEADRAVARFAEQTGLRCPAGCGACCANSTPMVSMPEAAAIAEELARRGHTAATLERARISGERRCALYEGDDRHGRCTVYDLRPAMCRLYGFAAVRRAGRNDLAVCRVHAMTIPDEVTAAVAHVDAGGEVPVLADWAEQSAALEDPPRPMMLMNDALLEMLQQVG
jgi:Fe-S-cluster containining protein